MLRCRITFGLEGKMSELVREPNYPEFAYRSGLVREDRINVNSLVGTLCTWSAEPRRNLANRKRRTDVSYLANYFVAFFLL